MESEIAISFLCPAVIVSYSSGQIQTVLPVSNTTYASECMKIF